jgi:hypothetical protein
VARFVCRGDVFAKMVEDDGLTGLSKGENSWERFVQRLSGDESSSKAISHAQAPDPIRHRLLC